MALRIGHKASAEQFGPKELVEYAVAAEHAGPDSVWVPDHFLPSRHEGGASRVWRSSALAPVRANPIGSPPRVHSRCSRSPQKYREWLAQ